MSDDRPEPGERPKPQYGEYAPEGWVSPAAGQEADAAAITHHAAPASPPPPSPKPASPKPVERAERRTWDVVLTVGLLGLGLYTVGSGYAAYSNLGVVMDQVFRQMGVGEFTAIDLAATIGVVIMVSHTILWIAGALLAARALRRNKLAFFWPLGAGVIAMIILFVLLAVIMFADPAFTAYMDRMSTTGG